MLGAMAKRCEVRIYQYRREQVSHDTKGRPRKLNLPPTHTFTVSGDSLEACRKAASARAESILGRFPPFSVAFAEATVDPKTGTRFDRSIVVTGRIPESE